MPVPSGFQAFLQFQQNMTQSTAQAGQFAAAMARLRLAEEHFQQRHEFDKEVFKAHQQRYDAELSLRDTQLKMAQAQLDAFQTQQQGQEQAVAAYSKFQEQAYGPYLAALASGEEEKAAGLSVKMDTMFGTLPAAAQQQFLETEQARLRLKMYPQAMMSQIAERLAKAQGTAGILSGADVAKNIEGMVQGLRSRIAGFDIGQRTEAHETRLRNLDEESQRLRDTFNTLARTHELFANSELASAMAGNLIGAQAAQNIFGSLSELKSKVTGKAKADLMKFEDLFRDLHTQATAENQNYLADVEKDQFAESLANGLAPLLSSVGADEAQSGQLMAQLSTEMGQYGQVFDALRGTLEFQIYQQDAAQTPEKREAVTLRLLQFLPGSENKQIRDSIMGVVDQLKYNTTLARLRSELSKPPATKQTGPAPEADITSRM